MAAISKVSICNQALIRIGAKIIANLNSDTSKEAKICNLVYDEALEELLTEFDWSFALYAVHLNLVANDNFISLYPYVFQIPSDCLYIKEVIDDTLYIGAKKHLHNVERLGIEPYVIRGNRIETAYEGIVLRYIKKIDTPALMPAYFRQVLALFIAQKICTAITDNASMYEQIFVECRNKLLEAKLQDITQRGQTFVDIKNHLSDVRMGK